MTLCPSGVNEAARAPGDRPGKGSPITVPLVAPGWNETQSHVLLTSGTVIGDPFPGLSPGALAASFTPDGQRVIVVSDSGSGWLWDVDPSHWETRACETAGRSLTMQEWQQLLPDRPYHATCGP